MNTTYPLASSTWGHEELAAIQSVIDSNRFTMGQKVFQFEKEFAEKFKTTDAVMVNSKVHNSKNIYANFIYCSHKKKLIDRPNFSPLTTQGYSVSKKAALSVGLIDKGIFKPNVCRDWTLIKKMEKKKYKKIFLDKVYCYHIAPHNFKDFYKTHFTRGQISAGYKYFFLNHIKLGIFLATTIKLAIFLIYLFSFYFWINNVSKISKQNKSNQKVFFKFLFIDLLRRISLIIGEFQTTFKIKK